jgi:hypothetical protein
MESYIRSFLLRNEVVSSRSRDHWACSSNGHDIIIPQFHGAHSPDCGGADLDCCYQMGVVPNCRRPTQIPALRHVQDSIRRGLGAVWINDHEELSPLRKLQLDDLRKVSRTNARTSTLSTMSRQLLGARLAKNPFCQNNRRKPSGGTHPVKGVAPWPKQ